MPIYIVLKCQCTLLRVEWQCSRIVNMSGSHPRVAQYRRRDNTSRLTSMTRRAGEFFSKIVYRAGGGDGTVCAGRCPRHAIRLHSAQLQVSRRRRRHTRIPTIAPARLHLHRQKCTFDSTLGTLFMQYLRLEAPT